MSNIDETEPAFRANDDLVWCDKLGSTAAFGFSFDPHFVSSSTLLDAASPITDSMIENKQNVKFTIDKQDHFSVSFTSFTGFNYTLDQSRAAVVYQHRLRIKRQSGRPPQTTMESVPRPYSILLEEVIQRSIRLSELLPKITTRKLTKIGIMATTAVGYDELPPGITSLLSYQNKAWIGEVTSFQLQSTVKLHDTELYSDRCIFTAMRNEDDEDGLVTVQLDWQRLFKNGRASTTRSLAGLALECQKEALAYFESLGDGTGYDEIIHRRAF